MRKPACNGSDDGNAVSAEIPYCAGGHSSDNRYEGPGYSRRKALKQKKKPTTMAETAKVGAWTSGSLLDTSANCITVRRADTDTPSISPSTAIPTWNPTPVESPRARSRDRKSAMKPSLSNRANSRNPAVSSATAPANAMYRALPGDAKPSGSAGEDRGGCRVSGDHQVAGGSERRESDERQQQRSRDR